MKIYLHVFTILFITLNVLACTGSSKKETPAQPDEIFDIHISDMSARDPFIFADPETKMYYLAVNGGSNVKMYKSKDLTMWKDEGVAFQPQPDFWGKADFWAPDLYFYKGKYYLFVTFSGEDKMRGTSVLVSDKPSGQYEPLVNKSTTPSDWMALDGALYFDEKNTPWMLYCHEWLQVKDGEIVAQQLSEDLKTTVGEPVVLFTASQAPWTPDYDPNENYITDAPVINKMPDGKLVMTWSSFGKDKKYNIGVCYSENGLFGPWVHDEQPLVDNDGGHAMLFKDFDGQMKISYHSPNSGGPARIMIQPVKYENGKLAIVQ